MSKGADPTSDERSFQYSGIPEEEAWLFSRLLFAWETPLFKRAAKLFKREEGLQQEDLLPLPHSDYGDVLAKKFEDKWAQVAATDTTKASGKKDGTLKMRKTIAHVLGWRFVWAGVIKVGTSDTQSPLKYMHVTHSLISSHTNI